MFTKNWYTMLSCMLLTNEYTKDVIILPDGSTSHYWSQSRAAQFTLSEYMKTVTTSLEDQGVVFGDGSIEPTFNDYTLSGNYIFTGLTVTVASITKNSDGGSVTAMYTITNTSDSEITISEVGLLGNCGIRPLIERTLLETPITIPVGGIGQVTYTLRMNHPTA